MINHTIGDATLGGHPATGLTKSVLAKQLNLTGIAVSWVYAGQDDSAVYFLVYVNGRLIQRLPGSFRAANVVALNYDTQDVQVIPWRQGQPPPASLYESIISRRAHLEWAAPVAPDVVAYKIYHSDTELGTYALHDTHDIQSLETGMFAMGHGVLLEVSGVYSGGAYTNELLTVTVEGDDVAKIQDSAGQLLNVPYSPGVPIVALPGVILTISGVPPTGSDILTASFRAGVQPFYDSAPMSAGTHWFKVSALDAAGNESVLSSAVPVVIQNIPAGVSDASVFYDESTGFLILTGVQSMSPDAVELRIYTNLDSSTNTLGDSVNMDVPFLETAVLHDQTFTISLVDTATLPPGVLQVVPIAVSSANIEDGTADAVLFSLPYVPPYLPDVMALTATATAGGGIELSWVSKTPPPFNPPDISGAWRISGLAAPLTVRPDPEDASGNLGYTVQIPSPDVGPEGLYSVTVAALSSSGAYSGAPSTVTVTTDATAPSVVTGLNAVGY